MGWGSKIAEGNYRIVYESIDHPWFCYKVLKSRVSKRITSLLCFGTSIEQHDIGRFVSLPENLLQYTPHIQKWWSHTLYELIVNYDWSQALSMDEFWSVDNEAFWNHIKEIYNTFLSKELYYVDLFHKWNNVVVQKLSENEWKPVIIDLKRMACRRQYPLQPQLLIKKFARNKFIRRWERFCSHFKWNSVDW